MNTDSKSYARGFKAAKALRNFVTLPYRAGAPICGAVYNATKNFGAGVRDGFTKSPPTPVEAKDFNALAMCCASCRKVVQHGFVDETGFFCSTCAQSMN